MGMETEPPDVYRLLLTRYETLHEEGKITDQELKFIKSARTIEDVLAEVTKSMAASEAKKNDKVVGLIGTGLEKLERVSSTIQIMIQSGSNLQLKLLLFAVHS